MSFNILDAFCQLGRHLKLQEDGLHSADHLLADMDHFGVSEALVFDSLARENHPAEGNCRILATTDAHPRLHPVWSALPTGAADEQPPPDELIALMRQHKVGALALFPRQYRFTLDDWCIDSLLEPLAEVRIPIFLNFNEVQRAGFGTDEADWSAIVALCRRWPELPIIVNEFRIRRGNRTIYRAFDACENLHVELSGYWLHRGIEYITSHWGARRLVYGSNWPRMGCGHTLATLTTADISDDDKRLIAGDTMRRLIAWCEAEHPAVELPEPADPFVAFGQSGVRPAEMTFADNHGHIGGKSCHYHLPNCDLEGIVADMNRLGVEKGCVFCFTGVFSDEQPGNDLVIEAVQRYPDKFVGFTMLSPHRGEREMIRELERTQAAGLRGIKLIPSYQGYPEEGPLIDVACRWAHEHRQLILNHYWGGPEQMERLISTYHQACFFTGHTTTAYAEVMQRHKNLYVCSCPLLAPGECEAVVDAIGADRFMFGSDLQDLPIAWGLGPILFARLSPAQKRLILGDNLRQVLTRYSLPA